MRETIREIFALRRNGYSGPFFLGLMLFLIGCWLLLPRETFLSSEAYTLMGDLASEIAWGLLMVMASSIIIVGSLARKPREVSLGALIAGGVWLTIFASMISSSLDTLLIPVTFTMVLRSASIFREFRTQFHPDTGKPLEGH